MKKWLICIVILLFCLVIAVAIFKNSNKDQNDNKIEEYVPQEEISEEQNRTTLLTLYFVDPKTKKIIPEARKIDVKEFTDSPYDKIMNFLIEGSQSKEIGKSVPDGTKINSISLQKENLVIDLSKEFIKGYEVGSKEHMQVIYSVVNTFLELKEITSVTFLIDGERVEGMEDSFFKIES